LKFIKASRITLKTINILKALHQLELSYSPSRLAVLLQVKTYL